MHSIMMGSNCVDIDYSRRSLIAPKSSILPRISVGSCRRPENRIIINVGGVRYETYKSTLKNIPDTRLSWLTNAKGNNPDFDVDTGEYFFDRHPGVFNMILNYYRTGKLHAPTDVCGPLFEEELAFWGLDEKQIEPCCWSSYRAHRDAQETLAEMDGGLSSDSDSDSDTSHLEDIREKFGIIEEHVMENKSWWSRNRPRFWKIVDEPKSSQSAKAFAILSLSVLLVSIMAFCMESHNMFRISRTPGVNISSLSVREKELYTQPMLFLDVIEYICVSFFTLELIARMVFCPSLKKFFQHVFNWVDICVVLSGYLCIVSLAIEPEIRGAVGFRFLNALRLIRIFRIFKMITTHVSALKILGHTMKASAKELLLLIVVLIIGVIIFACLIYYAEQVDEAETNSFSNIPQGFWWAVVTMTTLGYGDLYPRTALGYIVGTVCAVCGLLMLSLPVPVILSKFTLYYSHAQARQKLPKKSKKSVLLSAASALIDPDAAELNFNISEENISLKQETRDRRSVDHTSSDDSAIGSSYDKPQEPTETIYCKPVRFVNDRRNRYHKRKSAPPVYRYKRKSIQASNRGKNGQVGINVILSDDSPRALSREPSPDSGTERRNSSDNQLSPLPVHKDNTSTNRPKRGSMSVTSGVASRRSSILVNMHV